MNRLRSIPRIVRAAALLRDQPFFNETGGPAYRELGRAVDEWRGVDPYCTRHEQRLRPTAPEGCAAMNTNKRHHRILKTILFLALLAGIGMLAWANAAAAHVARPEACDAVWQAAPPGQRWATKQRCLAMVVRHNCVKHPRPVPGSVRVKGLRLMPGRDRRNSVDWRNQRKVVGWVVNEGLRRNLPYKVVLSALAAGTQESSLRELRYGHGTSLGPWQLIDSHGKAADRITVEFSGNWYLNGAMKVLRRDPAIGVAQLAQAVEVSAYPDNYKQWVPESAATLGAVLGPCHLRR